MFSIIIIQFLLPSVLTTSQYLQGYPPSYPSYVPASQKQQIAQKPQPQNFQQSVIPRKLDPLQRYPIYPYHYTPNHVPNSDPERKPETHIFYDANNQPYAATAQNETTRQGGDRAVSRWEYPHQIQIGNLTLVQFCAGTLVVCPVTGKQFVITAAHCLITDGTDQPRRKESLIIRAGNVRRDGNEGQFLKVKKYVIHPGSSQLARPPTIVKDDLAIIFPDGQFQLNWDVKPLPLPKQDQPLLANYISVTGWGYNREEGNMNQPSSLLRVVHLPIIDQATCQRQYEGLHGRRGTEYVTGSHFCAGFIQGGKDSCSGDSGGPASAIENGHSYLAGEGIFMAKDYSKLGMPNMVDIRNLNVNFYTPRCG